MSPAADQLQGPGTRGSGQVGIPVTRSDIFGPGGGIWLDGLPLAQPFAGKVASLRALIAVLDGEIGRLEEQMAA
jgi:hypothetical protein